MSKANSEHGRAADPAAFRVASGSEVDLEKCATRVEPLYDTGSAYRERLHEHCVAIDHAQGRLFANGTDGLLVVLQGMDASGKDGLIRRVFRRVDPAGLHCWSFAEPGPAELKEDYLRRYQRHLPQRGHIAVFNRSYYEDVLAVRVHPQWLSARDLHHHGEKVPHAFWERRYREINAFEQYLASNRIHVIKLMLHLSAEEQKARFLSRLRNPDKAWKLHENDLRDREHRAAFQQAYADCLTATATEAAPWYVLPADDKRNARLLAAAIVEQHLTALAGDWPQPTEQRKGELAKVLRRLEGEADD